MEEILHLTWLHNILDNNFSFTIPNQWFLVANFHHFEKEKQKGIFCYKIPLFIKKRKKEKKRN
jgi:hypothetical protein